MVWPGPAGQPPGEPDPGEETKQGQAGHQAQHAQPSPAQRLVELFLLTAWLRHDWSLSVVESGLMCQQASHCSLVQWKITTQSHPLRPLDLEDIQYSLLKGLSTSTGFENN